MKAINDPTLHGLKTVFFNLYKFGFAVSIT